MKDVVLVAGATGNLGGRIVEALLQRGAQVRALVRQGTEVAKLDGLIGKGVQVYVVDMMNLEEVSRAFNGVSCVVSALAGLDDVIIDMQKVLLDAAVAAKVPRFIPSDYSLDFTRFNNGENRNLDNRRAFHRYLDQAPIAATTIFNGAFADMLTGEMPLILFKQKLVLYWGNADHPMSFTTVADTSVYTANAALDPGTPRFLQIAGDQKTPREIRTIVSEVTGERFRLLRAGGSGLLGFLIKVTKKFAPGAGELYPPWQGMQYMHNMIDHRANLDISDRDRYAGMKWTTVRQVLEQNHRNAGN
jgi:uncharacterized protein YbjT (DUF2867 family)